MRCCAPFRSRQHARIQLVDTDGGLDVVGDVHGEYDALVRLLTKMGYARRDGAWRHPERQAVFVGDLIDRGDEQAKVVTLVREMHDAAS